MTRWLRTLVTLAVVIVSLPSSASPQQWRRDASNIGPLPRVLIVGTRPEDEDNALIAWLSLGHGMETAFLSVTRGEASPNVTGSERQSALAVLRTAELLAERQRDGARQYFTRAYDFGAATEDSVVDRLWPRDTLLRDIAAVIRAFRPHVIIALGDTLDRDATRRRTAKLVRDAFVAAGDTTVLPVRAASRLPAWSATRLFTRVDSTATAASVVVVDVGEFDVESGKTYAELGAEIRRLQRTQPQPRAPRVGPAPRWFRLDASHGGNSTHGLFDGIDTTWNRFRSELPPGTGATLDTLRAGLATAAALLPSGTRQSIAEAYARVVQQSITARLAMECTEIEGVPTCGGWLGDLAATLRQVRERATRAALGAAGVVVDGTVSREFAALRDTVAGEVVVFNGGTEPLIVRHVAANGRLALVTLVRDSVRLLPDSTLRWSGAVRADALASHWWQVNGLIDGKAIHAVGPNDMQPVFRQLIAGEDRQAVYGPEATVAINGVDLSVAPTPWAFRGPGMVRGDDRHVLAGLRPISILLERTAEYERASIPIDRVFRVYVSSARASTDTVFVQLRTPRGVKPDTAERRVVLPPFGGINVFFRIRGQVKAGSDSISAKVVVPASVNGTARSAGSDISGQTYQVGTIPREYPHVPTQIFVRLAGERLEAVDLRVPPRLRVAYVKGTDDVPTPLGQLQVNVQTLDASLLSIVDLSVYSTVLIGSDAARGDALAGAAEPLKRFMRQGGTVVVLPNSSEIARSGLLPYPVVFDTVTRNIANPDVEVHLINPRASLLSWPNAIGAADFKDWSGERARNVPLGFDGRYGTVVAVGDPDAATPSTILTARVGRGMLVYSSLALDTQLAAVHPGAARLFVNMLAAGLAPSTSR